LRAGDHLFPLASIVNLTQHTYYNPASERGASVLNHETIHASYYTPVNRTLIPTGQIASVDGTPFDFRQPVLLRRALSATHPQLGIAGGFDHNFILRRPSAGLVRAATLHEPTIGSRARREHHGTATAVL